MGDIQRGDSSARRRAILFVIIGSLIGGFALLAFERAWPLIERWLVSDPEQWPQRVATLTGFLVLVTAGPLFAFAIHLWRRGARIRRHRRFPLEGERRVRDTQVVRGEAAAIRGQALQYLAIALAVLAAGLAVLLWRLAAMLGHHAV
jgi:hypothetical protein